MVWSAYMYIYMVSWQHKIKLYVWEGNASLRVPRTGSSGQFWVAPGHNNDGNLSSVGRTFNHLKSKRQVPLKRREREKQREGILNREVDCLPTPLERIADDTKIVYVCVTNHETNGQWSHQYGQIQPNPAAIFIIKTIKNQYASLAYLPLLFVQSSR